MKLFYDEVKSKRKNKSMRLQVNNEFQLVKIKDLNDEKNVTMFTSSARGAKVFIAEQQVREPQTRITKLNSQKLNITPTKKNFKFCQKYGQFKSEKYGFSPEEIEK